MDQNQNEDQGSIDLIKIDATYLVRLVGGSKTTKGSFWAFDEHANEYYIGPSLVKNNPEKINQLVNKELTYWALIQKVIWGGSWDDKEVEEVMILTEEEKSCENFRDLLKSLNRVRLEKVEKFETLLESIKKGESPIKIEELENQVGNLDEIITSTSAKLDKYKGWMEINW